MKNGIKLPDEKEIEVGYISSVTGGVLLKIVKASLIKKPGQVTVSFERLLTLLK